MPFLLADLWLRSLLDLKIAERPDPPSQHEITTRLFSYPNILEFQTVVGYQSARRYHQALPACERLLTRKPWFLPLYSWAAISALELDLPYRTWQLVEDGVQQIEKEQLRVIKETLSLPKELEQRFNSERAKLFNILGLAFARARNYNQAISYFEDAQMSDPTWRSWMVRGKMDWLKGSTDQAAAFFRAGLKECSHEAQRAAYHIELARLRESQTRFEDGRRLFLQARLMALDDTDVREAYLIALTERGEFEPVLAEITDSDSFSKVVRKNSLLARKLEDRVCVLETAASNFRDSRRYFRLGQLYMRSRQVVKAIQSWLQGLDHSPGNANCALFAARALVEKGGLIEAGQILETAIDYEQRTENNDPRLMAARCYVMAQSHCPLPWVIKSMGRCLKLMAKLDRSKKRQQHYLEQACGDFIKAVCVVQYWRYLAPAIRLLEDNPEFTTVEDAAAVSYDAAFLAARGLKDEQFLEIPTFNQLKPLALYLLFLHQRAVRSRQWTKVRIIGDAVSALVESYPEHEQRIVREYQSICRRESPKGRPAKRLSVGRVEKLLSEGLSLEKIGKKLNVHRNTIYRHADSDKKLKTALHRGRVKYRRIPQLIESQVSPD